MIARLWHGVTLAPKADEYLAFLNKVAVPDYQASQGNLGVYLLRRMEGDQAHFLILTLWETRDALAKYAGAEIEKARYYPEDGGFLVEFELNVTLYEVMAVAPNRVFGL